MLAYAPPAVLMAATLIGLGIPSNTVRAQDSTSATPTMAGAEVAIPVLTDVVVRATPEGTLVEAIIVGGTTTVRENGRGTPQISFDFGSVTSGLVQGSARVGRGPVESLAVGQNDAHDALILTINLSGARDYGLAGTDSSLIIMLPGSQSKEQPWRLSRVVPPNTGTVLAATTQATTAPTADDEPAPRDATAVAAVSSLESLRPISCDIAADSCDIAKLEAEAIARARRAAHEQLAQEAELLKESPVGARPDVTQELPTQPVESSVVDASVLDLRPVSKLQGDTIGLTALAWQADSIRLEEAKRLAETEIRALQISRDSLVAENASIQASVEARRRAESDSVIAQLRAEKDSLMAASEQATQPLPAETPVQTPVQAPVEAPKSPESQIVPTIVSDDTSPINIRFRQTPIETVLAAFSARSQRSIIAGAGLDGILVTADINNQPWAVALEAILSAQGLVARTLPSGIIQVEAKSTLAEAEKVDQLETRLFPLNFAAPDSILPSVKSLSSKRGSVVADKGANAIVASDIPSVLDRMANTIEVLDKAPKRVSIRAKLVYISSSDMDAMGFSYDIKDSRGPTGFNDMVAMPGRQQSNGSTSLLAAQPTVALTQTTGAGVVNGAYRVAKPSMKLLATLAGANSRFTLVSFLEMLRQLELAHMEATPIVVVNDNHVANLIVGEQVPVRVMDAGVAGGMSMGGGQGAQGGLASPMATVQFKDVGIKLSAKPHVTSDGQIMMEIEAENSNASVSSPDIGMTFKQQRIATRVQVADGETLVVGSLTVTERSKSRVGVPFLSSIPYLGRLFSTTTENANTRDLVILVTPTVVQ